MKVNKMFLLKCLLKFLYPPSEKSAQTAQEYRLKFPKKDLYSPLHHKSL